jgi:hypothetical protein
MGSILTFAATAWETSPGEAEPADVMEGLETVLSATGADTPELWDCAFE